jgi:hypothetical protein
METGKKGNLLFSPLSLEVANRCIGLFALGDFELRSNYYSYRLLLQNTSRRVFLRQHKPLLMLQQLLLRFVTLL